MFERTRQRKPNQPVPSAPVVRRVPQPTVTPRGEQVRRSLEVGAVDDPAEHEADLLADRAVEMMRSLGQPTDHQQRVQRSTSGADADTSPAPRVRRRADSALADPVAGGALDEHTSSRIERSRGSGQPLPDSVRPGLEDAFDRPLDSVRVHTGNEAAGLSSAISAKAFTTGNDIYFGAGQFRPGSADGQRLLAHEVAHTVQDGGQIGRTIRRLDDGSSSKAGDLEVKKAMFEISLGLVVPQLQMLLGQLPLMQSFAMQALTQPSMIGPLMAAKTQASVHCTILKAHHTTLSNAWAGLKPYTSSHPAASALEPLDELINDLGLRIIAWEALIEGTGPGAGGLPIQVLTELVPANAVLGAFGKMALSFATVTAPVSAPPPKPEIPKASEPASSAPPVPSGYDAPPILAAGRQQAAPSQAAPAAPASAGPVGAVGGDLVEQALQPSAGPVRVPKRYPFTKARQARYEGENIDGSADLPHIFAAAERDVAQGKIGSVGAYMIKHFGWSQGDVEKYITGAAVGRFGWSQPEQGKVKYLDETERKDFQIDGGAPVTQGEEKLPFDTSNMFSKHSGKGWGIYVMSPDGTMYADQHKVGLFHHSSFLAGATVAGAGEIMVDKGTVKGVTNKTGHYLAGEQELWQVIDELKSRGVSLSGIEVTVVTGGTRGGAKTDAKRFWDDNKPD